MAKPLGEERWAVVRRLYEGDELTVEKICALAGIAQCTLARRARCDGWDRRPQGGRPSVRSRARAQLAATRPAGALDLIGPAASPGGDEAAVPAVDRLALLRRLWAALDRHMADEEAGLHGPDPRRPQMLDVMVRTIERLSAIEGSGAEAAEAPGAAGADDGAALRADLLRRIEALTEES